MKYYLREAGDRVGIVVGAVKGGLAAKLCRRVEEFEGQSLVYGRRWHYARSPFRKQRRKGAHLHSLRGMQRAVELSPELIGTHTCFRNPDLWLKEKKN